MTDKKTKLEKKAESLHSTAMKIRVTDQPSFDRAKKGLGVLKELEAEIRNTFDPVIQKANETHKAALAARKKHLDPVQEAKGHLSRQAGAYVEEQRRIRQEAERKIREAQEAEDQRLRDLAAAQGEGPETPAPAEDNDTKELPAPAPIQTKPLPPPPITAGLRTTTTWKFKILNQFMIPREFMTPDMQKIGALGREQKNLAKVPGVEFYSETKTG